MEIKEYLTTCNYWQGNGAGGIKENKYIVIHYVGAVSTAENNAKYFYNTYRGASANYFVDENEIYRVVKDSDTAWHCGTTGAYKNPYCRNTNSIGIEMCCYMNNGKIDISEATVQNTLELAAYICKTYGITIDRVIRHYDVTGKKCPAPMVEDNMRWEDFKKKLNNLITETVVVPVEPKEEITMNKTMYVIAKSGLNVRSGAGTNYKVVRAVPCGAEVTVYEMSNGWARIGSGEWCSATYLKEGNTLPYRR